MLKPAIKQDITDITTGIYEIANVLLEGHEMNQWNCVNLINHIASSIFSIDELISPINVDNLSDNDILTFSLNPDFNWDDDDGPIFFKEWIGKLININETTGAQELYPGDVVQPDGGDSGK